MRNPLLLGSVLLSLALIAAPAASADDRYATPTGGGPSASCLQVAPCSIVGAFADANLDDGDRIILAPGVYPVAVQLQINKDVDVLGPGDPALTRIESSLASGSSFYLSHAGASLEGVEINSVSSTGGLFAYAGTVRRVIVRSKESTACFASSPTIIGSLCATSGEGNTALTMNFGGGTHNAILRNSTFIGGSDGVGIYVGAGDSTTVTVNALSSIFVGGDRSVIASEAVTSSTTIFTAVNSSYERLLTVGAASVSPLGVGTNQKLPPVFTNRAAGNYSQAPTSPTIDKGAVDSLSALLDLSGNARTLGAAPDIGAYEYVPPAPPAAAPIPDTTKPKLTISKKPKSKTRSRKLRVTFKANEPATYRCKLDKGKFKACKSPYKKSKLKRGKHKLQIKATDAAGNVSKTKTIKWTVKAP